MWVDQDFAKITIVNTPNKHAKSIEQIEQIMDQQEPFSVRWLAPKLSIGPTIVWKILRYDWKA